MVADVIAGPNVGLVLIPIIGLLVPIVAIIDAANQPAPAFYAAGSNKTAWIVVLIVATVLGIGLFLGGWYLIAVRPRVRRQIGGLH
jgi:hypothetical protein